MALLSSGSEILLITGKRRAADSGVNQPDTSGFPKEGVGGVKYVCPTIYSFVSEGTFPFPIPCKSFKLDGYKKSCWRLCYWLRGLRVPFH